MAGSSSARIGRFIVALIMLALVLGGLGASPASANQRGTAVNEANNVISACIKADGDPWEVFADSHHIGVYCAYDDGMITCTWEAGNGWVANCSWAPTSVVRDPAGGAGADGSGTNLPERVAAVAPGQVTAVGSGTQAVGDGARTVEKQQKQQKKSRGKDKHQGKYHGKGQHKGSNRR